MALLLIATLFGVLLIGIEASLFGLPFVVLAAGYAYLRRTKRQLSLDGSQLVVRSVLGTTSCAWADVTAAERTFDDGIRLSLAPRLVGGDRPAFADPD